jgi:hypothetical protein
MAVLLNAAQISWPVEYNQRTLCRIRTRRCLSFPSTAMGWIVGGKAAQRSAASPSQMGRFETQWLAAPKNFAALADLSGQWIDLVHSRRPPRGIVLDMDSTTLHRMPYAGMPDAADRADLIADLQKVIGTMKLPVTDRRPFVRCVTHVTGDETFWQISETSPANACSQSADTRWSAVASAVVLRPQD